MNPMCERCGAHPQLVGWGEDITDVVWLCLNCFNDALCEVGLRIQSITTAPIAENN